MKLLTPFAAIIAAAAAGQVYSSQPHESYANSAEIYQSALEYQQHGLYSDQSQYSGADQSHVVGAGDESAYSGHKTGEKVARILSLVSENDGHGYQYSYETENGIKAQESGLTSEMGTEAHGAYSYTGDDGQVYTVTYTADEHGFHPQGAHLPTSPPIPEAIAKSLEQNAKDEAAGIFDDGKYVDQHQHQYSQQSQQQHKQIQLNQQIQQLHQPIQQLTHQQGAQAFQYETTAFQNDGLDGYHTMNVPGYHKH